MWKVDPTLTRPIFRGTITQMLKMGRIMIELKYGNLLKLDQPYKK